MPYRDRLKLATEHAGVEYSQTAIARSLSVNGKMVNKQTVDKWMGDGQPDAEMIFHQSDVWKVDARWLATGAGDMLPRGTGATLEAHERDLLDDYRRADARWQFALRTLAELGTTAIASNSAEVNIHQRRPAPSQHELRRVDRVTERTALYRTGRSDKTAKRKR